MLRKKIWLVFPLLLAVGCGGGSSPNQPLLDDRLARREALATAFNDAADVATATLPGSAQYTGIAVAGGGLNRPDGEPGDIRVLFYGDLVLDVDFNDGSLSGEGRDFVQVRDVDGQLAGDLASGTLAINGTRGTDTEDAVFDVSVTGRIDGAAGSFLDLNSADMTGTIQAKGPDVDFISLQARADIVFDDGDGYAAVGGHAGR